MDELIIKIIICCCLALVQNQITERGVVVSVLVVSIAVRLQYATHLAPNWPYKKLWHHLVLLLRKKKQQWTIWLMFVISVRSDRIGFEKAYCEYRLNRVETALKTIEGLSEQTDKLKELYGQVVRTLILKSDKMTAFGTVLTGLEMCVKINYYWIVITQQGLESKSLCCVQTF